MRANRRSFIKCAGMAAGGSALGLRPFGALNALAQSTPGYKALVCVYLYGGNDANNMLMPFDTAGYQNYSSIRGALALAQNTLLPLTPAPNFAVHPSMPDIQNLFNSSNAAFVANMGTLVQPLTVAQYKAGQSSPSNLFSHLDQQLESQNAAQSGAVQTGWGGRIADVLSPIYNPGASYPMVTSVCGVDSLFCNGNNSTAYTVSPGNIGTPSCTEGSACTSRRASEQALLSLNSGVSLVQADSSIAANAYTYNQTIAEAVQSLSPLQTVFPTSYIGTQLQQIAQLIKVRAALGVQRQIFFAGFDGFDTHSGQLSSQSIVLGELSSAIGAFYNATTELNVSSDVTLFTMSDFGRTCQDNSSYGSDHAWGSHHIVVGGAVKGGQIYGTYPTLVLGGPDDADIHGRWVPTTSCSQYAATLAQWFGVSVADLPTILPYLSNFSTQNLGFV